MHNKQSNPNNREAPTPNAAYCENGHKMSAPPFEEGEYGQGCLEPSCRYHICILVDRIMQGSIPGYNCALHKHTSPLTGKVGTYLEGCDGTGVAKAYCAEGHFMVHRPSQTQGRAIGCIHPICEHTVGIPQSPRNTIEKQMAYDKARGAYRSRTFLEATLKMKDIEPRESIEGMLEQYEEWKESQKVVEDDGKIEIEVPHGGPDRMPARYWLQRLASKEENTAPEGAEEIITVSPVPGIEVRVVNPSVIDELTTSLPRQEMKLSATSSTEVVNDNDSTTTNREETTPEVV